MIEIIDFDPTFWIPDLISLLGEIRPE